MAGPFNLFPKFSLFKAKSKVKFDSNRARSYTVSNPFHAVSISAAPDCCRAAKSSGDERFLATEAPQLPLPGCDAARCKCQYIHHDDRRSGLRRDSDVLRRRNAFWHGQERRRAGGRRINDV